MTANEANPGLSELVEALTEGGYQFELRPSGGVDDGTSRQVYYALRVHLDGLTPVELKHLLAVVDGSPYNGRISDGGLVLERERR